MQNQGDNYERYVKDPACDSQLRKCTPTINVAGASSAVEGSRNGGVVSLPVSGRLASAVTIEAAELTSCFPHFGQKLPIPSAFDPQ